MLKPTLCAHYRCRRNYAWVVEEIRPFRPWGTSAFRRGDGIFIRDYEEAGKSAFNEKSLDKRTAYQQLLMDAQAGLFDEVLVYKSLSE